MGRVVSPALGLPDKPTRTDWIAFFSRYETIALYANASGVPVGSPPPGSLAIVFNRFVVPGLDLSGTPTLLIVRNAHDGIALVARGKFDAIWGKFGDDTPDHAVRLTASPDVEDGPSHHLPIPTVELDLRHHFTGRYPSDMVPSTGYAVASWLADLRLDARIELVGFTGVRSETNRVSYIHDWTFERASLAAHASAGRLHGVALQDTTAMDALAAVHPDVPRAELAERFAAALQERALGTDFQVDRLLSATKLGRTLAGAWRSAKSKRAAFFASRKGE